MLLHTAALAVLLITHIPQNMNPSHIAAQHQSSALGHSVSSRHWGPVATETSACQVLMQDQQLWLRQGLAEGNLPSSSTTHCFGHTQATTWDCILQQTLHTMQLFNCSLHK
jgi:hypothetical protein